MTANINIQNKPAMPELAKPVLKAVDHPSKDIKEEPQKTIRPIDSAKTEKSDKKADISKVDKAEETAEEQEASEQALGDAVKQLNSYVQSINRNLEFNIDKDSGQTVVKVIDAETDEMIRQIPNEEALKIAKQLDISLKDGSKSSELLLIRAKA
ncbi:MAG: flagellar protein FlaG [Methylococcaceae bacterium]|nr:flagellar protein FlaG [Methylococcaceae bacterium]